MRPLALATCLALASCASGADPRPPAAADPSPHDVCVAVMHRTRSCADAFVPGLLALRVRLDRPPGIAGRFASEGEAAMLALAREQFAADWSDDAVATNCATLAAKPPAEQERLVAPARARLAAAGCAAFAACDLADKERRWKGEP